MDRRAGFSSEAALYCLIGLFGIFIILVSLAYGFGTFPKPGPGLYPFFVGLAILLACLALLRKALRSQTGIAFLAREKMTTFCLMNGAFCLWILLMPLLGYVVVTLLATAAIGKIMRLEGWWKPVAVSAGTALFIYLLFDYWLYIDLPRGFWQ